MQIFILFLIFWNSTRWSFPMFKKACLRITDHRKLWQVLYKKNSLILILSLYFIFELIFHIKEVLWFKQSKKIQSANWLFFSLKNCSSLQFDKRKNLQTRKKCCRSKKCHKKKKTHSFVWKIHARKWGTLSKLFLFQLS